jgi:hypothetical protein
MTPASPNWGDVEAFLRADGWTRLAGSDRGGRRQSHIFFEKVLDGGRVLQTHISHDRSSTVPAGRFGAILRDQLEVKRDEFWEAVRSGRPVGRPVPVDEDAANELPSWVVSVLAGPMRLGPDEISRLTEAEAIEMVHQHWSEPGGE